MVSRVSGKPHASKDWYVLVHPGSMFGSAEHNLGEREASRARDEVFAELAHSDGSMNIAVIHGFLPDEIEPTRLVELKIAEAINHESGLGALRLWGCDAGSDADPELGPFDGEFNHQSSAAEHLATLVEDGAKITVSGAWHDPVDGIGCVTGVAEVLANAFGKRAEIRISAKALVL